MLVACDPCARSTFHTLRPVIAAEDGNEYALACCIICSNKVILICDCGVSLAVRRNIVADARKELYTLYCPQCDRLDEMVCPPTRRNTCENT